MVSYKNLKKSQLSCLLSTYSLVSNFEYILINVNFNLLMFVEMQKN